MEIRSSGFHLPPLVFYNDYDNVGFVLDIRHSNLIELSERDTCILSALLQCETLAEATHQLKAHTPSAGIEETEILTLVERLVDQHVLESGQPSSPTTCTIPRKLTKQHMPPAPVERVTLKQRLTGAGHIISVLNELRKGEEGLYKADQYLQKLKESIFRTVQPTLAGEQWAGEFGFYRLITGLVEHRLAHLLGQEAGNEGLCMIRSVALCVYLLSLGIPVYVVIARPKYGARRGFKLHVWVEKEEKPLNDHPNVGDGYMVMYTFPA